MDVLEHIADDHGFLTQLLAHPALSADTRVVITVPAHQALFCSHDKAVLKNVLILASRVSSRFGRLGLTVPGLSNFAVCRKSA